VILFKYLPVNVIKFIKSNPIAARYVVDGLFIGSAVNIAASNVNLFAMRLGANDYQLSLVQFLPQMFTLMVLIPGGLYMDSIVNKKRIVIVTLAVILLGYLLCSLSPFSGVNAIPFFLTSLSLAGGAMALYLIAWQSFFPNVVDHMARNKVLTLRTRIILYINVIVPVLIGIVLASIGTLKGKIIAHQAFFLCTCLLLLLNALNFRRFRTARFTELPKRISFSEIKKAGKSLLHNKPFVIFALSALFFHMTWHLDWTLYFIGQVQYLGMNEFQLGLVPMGAAAIQIITLKFWSRKNERHGVVLPFTFGILGLSLCPVFMIISVSLRIPAAPYLFIIFHMLAHIPFCVITLNLFQCLLQVVDEKNRSFSMSVFACLLCFSNAVMPVAGVALYHFLGGDINGFRYTFAILFVLRIIAAGFWFLRWRSMPAVKS